MDPSQPLSRFDHTSRFAIELCGDDIFQKGGMRSRDEDAVGFGLLLGADPLPHGTLSGARPLVALELENSTLFDD
jgi:hypothetical protein